MLEKLRSKYWERCHFSKNQNFGVSWVLTTYLSVSPSADFSKLTFFSTLQVNSALQCVLLSLQNPRFFYELFKSTGDFKALDRRKAQKSLELFQIYKTFIQSRSRNWQKILQSNKNNEKNCLNRKMLGKFSLTWSRSAFSPWGTATTRTVLGLEIKQKCHEGREKLPVFFDTEFAKKCDKLKTTCRPSVWWKPPTARGDPSSPEITTQSKQAFAKKMSTLIKGVIRCICKKLSTSLYKNQKMRF